MSIHYRFYHNPSLTERDGKKWYNIHLLRGYGRTLDSIKEMFEIFKQYFPNLSDKDVEVSVITKSSSVKSFTLLHFGIYLSPEEVEALKNKGWYLWDWCEYSY